MHWGPFFHWAHDTWLGQFVRASSWVYTAGLMVHFTGLALLMGAMLLIDLRLLGVERSIPPGAVLKFLPVAIIGFCLNLATGIMFFCFDPARFGLNPAFQVKMLLILLAGLNAIWFSLAEHRHLVHAPGDLHTPINVKISAGLSLFFWFGVIVAGRLIVAFGNS
jgi:hypothetical protein